MEEKFNELQNFSGHIFLCLAISSPKYAASLVDEAKKSGLIGDNMGEFIKKHCGK